MFLVNVVVMFVINVNECSFNVAQTFEFTLKRLANIMRCSERSIRVHNHINFNPVFLASVVSAALSNRLDHA